MVIAVLLALSVWHRSRISVAKAAAGVGGLYLVGFAVAMLLATWCPWASKIAHKKEIYVNLVGGLFILGYGFKIIRFAFGRGGGAEDGGILEHADSP